MHRRTRPRLIRIQSRSPHPDSRCSIRSRFPYLLLPYSQHGKRILDRPSRDGVWYPLWRLGCLRFNDALRTASSSCKVRVPDHTSRCGYSSNIVHWAAHPFPQRSLTAFRTSQHPQNRLDIFSKPALLGLLGLQFTARLRVLLPFPVLAFICLVSRSWRQERCTCPSVDEHLSSRWTVRLWSPLRSQSTARCPRLLVHHGCSDCLSDDVETSRITSDSDSVRNRLWFLRRWLHCYLGQDEHRCHRRCDCWADRVQLARFRKRGGKCACWTYRRAIGDSRLTTIGNELVWIISLDHRLHWSVHVCKRLYHLFETLEEC